ncbi:MAG: hypothetical protein U0519_03270 [Candidatus Gracilibacteria bacterium]
MAEALNLQQAYHAIQGLIKEEKWLDAHRACLEILRFDPENLKIIHLKNRIEKNVRKINQKAIKDDIEKLKPLWKEERYEELLLNLKHLEPYIKDYPKLKPIITKATQKYTEQLKKVQEKSYTEEIGQVDKYLSEKKFQDALLLAEKLKIMGIHRGELKKKIKSIQHLWIENEISSNKTLLAGTKYEDILLFYHRMQKIDPESAAVKSLMEKTKKQYQSYKIEEKKEFIYKSLEAIKTLYQLKKYEKALEASKEIIEIDPSNKIALSFMRRSAKKVRNLIDGEITTQIRENYKNLKEEYKKNKKDFTRI